MCFCMSIAPIVYSASTLIRKRIAAKKDAEEGFLMPYWRSYRTFLLITLILHVLQLALLFNLSLHTALSSSEIAAALFDLYFTISIMTIVYSAANLIRLHIVDKRDAESKTE